MHKLGVEHCYIELIEHFPCNYIYELRAGEGHVIREKGTLNKNIAGRNNKQHYQDNKELYNKYHEDNKEHIKHIKQQYYEDNKQHLLNRGKQYNE